MDVEESLYRRNNSLNRKLQVELGESEVISLQNMKYLN